MKTYKAKTLVYIRIKHIKRKCRFLHLQNIQNENANKKTKRKCRFLLLENIQTKMQVSTRRKHTKRKSRILHVENIQNENVGFYTYKAFKTQMQVSTRRTYTKRKCLLRRCLPMSIRSVLPRLHIRACGLTNLQPDNSCCNNEWICNFRRVWYAYMAHNSHIVESDRVTSLLHSE